MNSTTYMPLRTTAGSWIPLKNARIIDHSDLLQPSDHIPTTNMGITTYGRRILPVHVPYADFQPAQLAVGGTAANFSAGDGVASFPFIRRTGDSRSIDVDLERTMRGSIPSFDEFSSIWVVGPEAVNGASNELWIEVELSLADEEGCPLIGGIFYGGYPMLPYYVTTYGANSANFGLPREIRVSWDGYNGEGFLDTETAVVQREITSHSGVHVLATGPVRSNRLRIRLIDFPTIIRRVESSGNQQKLAEFHGILIPYLGVFTYREDVRFAPPVSAGLLAAITFSDQSSKNYYLDPNKLIGDNASQVRAVAADQVLTFSSTSHHFYPLSAASMFHTGRSYRHPLILGLPADPEEIFISQLLSEGDQVRIYFAQGEEHRRCLGGLTITGVMDHRVERYFNGEGNGQFDLAVYELDPVEGVSPIAPERDPAQDKYAMLIGLRKKVGFTGGPISCTFVRPSSARNFVAVFTCVEAGRLGLTSLQPIQSAHVHLAPRPARSQQIRQIHFRLIGPNLAEDYARLGREGFKFSIEHVVGGEVKDVLFEACTLSDLLQLSGTRLHANQRFLETHTDVSLERRKTAPGSYEHRYTYVGSHGWRRSQSGAGVSFTPVQQNWLQGLRYFPHNPAGIFRTYSNAETRNKTQHLGFVGTEGPLPVFLSLLETLLGIQSSPLVPRPSAIHLTRNGWGDQPGQMWEGIGITLNSLNKINGLLNVSAPPVKFERDFYRKLIALMNNPFSVGSNGMPTIVNVIDNLPNAELRKFMLLNSISFGANVGAGLSMGVGANANVGGSISVSQTIPTVTRTAATGETGNITFQATRTGKSYAQSLNDGFDESESRTRGLGGFRHDKVIRSLLRPGTVRKRTPGVQIQWQEQVMDVVVGSVPLVLNLPALADKVYSQRDEWVRVRFGNGMRDGLAALSTSPERAALQSRGATDVVMDVWFDLKEEVVRDDY